MGGWHKMTKEKKVYGTFKEFLRERYEGPLSATDILIRYNDGKKEGLVLIERKFPPYGIAIPGGIHERMSGPENAIKEAKEETGLDVIIDPPIYRPFSFLSGVNDDPRAYISSVCYTAKGYGNLKPMEEEDAKWARVFTEDEIVNLLYLRDKWAFERHMKMLAIYLSERKKLPKNLEHLIPKTLEDLR